MNTLETIFGIASLLGLLSSVIFYFREKLSKKELEQERKKIEEIKNLIHWQLQSIHHECNRIENIMNHESRPDRSVIEVARCIKDHAGAMMGQLIGEIKLYPWTIVPIIDSNSKKEIGKMVGTYPVYSDDFEGFTENVKDKLKKHMSGTFGEEK